MMKWGSGSQHLTALLKQASEDVILKVAAGASAAAGMLGDQQGMAEQQQQPQESATKSDQLRQMAEMEPDMQKKQFLLSVADSIDNTNAPVEVAPETSQMMDPSQEMMMQGGQPQAQPQQVQQKAASAESDFGEVSVSNSPDFSFGDDGKYANEMSAQDFESYLLNS